MRYFDREKSLQTDWDSVFAPRDTPFSANGSMEENLANFAAALHPFGPTSNFKNGQAGVNNWFWTDPMVVQELRGELSQGRGAADLTQRPNFDVTEDALAAYVRLNFADEIGGWPVRGNLGLRYVDTKTVSTMITPTFTVTISDDGNLESITVDELNEETAQYEDFDNSYGEWLPSFNMVANPSENVNLRFAIARTMSRPLYEELGRTLAIAGSAPGDYDDVITVTAIDAGPDRVLLRAGLGLGR